MSEISLAIATFNEEQNIIRCLDSVKGLVTEIVAVDGSSTDNTAKLLKKYGARVEVTNNPLNFHINKNKAIKKCKGDWILQLDADEEVTKELAEEIRDVVNGKSEFNGHWIPRKNLFLGKFLTKGGQYPDYTLRLYKRGMGMLPEKSVHEQAKIMGKSGYLKNPLLHYSYPDFAHYMEHFSVYTNFTAAEFAKDNLKLNILTFLDYIIKKPVFWFLWTFIRHKGFYDGYQGFLFSLFSALRFPVSYIKYWEKKK